MRTPYVANMLAVLACTALVAVSCSPDTTGPGVKQSAASGSSLQKLENLRAKYGWVGQYHTDGLAFIYARLVRNRKSIHNRADACREAAIALKEFHRTARHGEVPAGMVDPAISNEVCGEAAADANLAVSRSVSVSTPGVQVRTTELSVTAGYYLDQLNTVVYAATSRSGLENDINRVEINAAAALPEYEAGAVAAVGSVALSSADYWAENLGYWVGFSTGTPSYSIGVQGAKIESPSAYLTYGNTPSWWNNKFVKGYLKVLGADVTAGGRTAFSTWMAGPVGWDAAAAAALWASSMMAISLLFF